MQTQADYVVILRSKAVKGLGLEQNPSQKNLLINNIVNFRGSTPKEAVRTIFQLIYSGNAEVREEILRGFGFTLCESATNYTLLSEEQVILLGNELRYQYKECYPQFLEIENDSRFQEELDQLKNAMNQHPILLFRAVEMCRNSADSSEMVTTCLEPLMSDNTDSQIYGLRKMGHNAQYQQLLLPYAKKIGELLKAVYEAHQEEKKIQEAKKESQNFPSPFAQLANLMAKKNQQPASTSKTKSEATVVRPDKQLAEQSAPQVQEFERSEKYALSSNISNILAHRAELVRNIPQSEDFWACLRNLRSMKIDLNDLVDREELIRKILATHSALDDAIALLYDAEQEFAEAQKYFSFEDFATIEKLYHTRKACDAARENYSRTFAAFTRACEAYDA